MNMTYTGPLRWAPFVCAISVGCAPSIDIGELATDGSSGEPTESSAATMTGPGSGSGTATSGDTDSVVLDVGGPDVDPSEVRKMDILFVVDNSGSMGPEQARLVEAATQITAVLDSPGIAVDWRLGITTTDNGNPWCPGTTPEAGALVASSCRSRLADFVFEGAVQVDVTEEACTDLCALDELALLPTATDADPAPAVRPWISGGCDSNLADPAQLADVVSCAVPQGINGCGFEQPLESMRKAILRSRDPGDASFGFVRSDAHLVIIVLSDEADCSTNSAFDSIFLQEGIRAFWDTDWITPTSAICWRAGVQCSGDPSAMTCQSAGFDELGAPTDDPGAMVMHPVSEYRDFLDGVAAEKAPGAGVFVVGAVGLPLGGGPPLYADVSATDPMQMTSFGIGAGCSSEDGDAVPPVRMLELFGAYPPPSGGNSSICDASYGDTVEAVTSIVGAGIIESDQVCP